MYLTRRDLYYPLLSLLITNTISVTLRWNTRRKVEIYRGSKWRVDRRFDPLPLPMLHLNCRQHSTTDRNTTLGEGRGH